MIYLCFQQRIFGQQRKELTEFIKANTPQYDVEKGFELTDLNVLNAGDQISNSNNNDINNNNITESTNNSDKNNNNNKQTNQGKPVFVLLSFTISSAENRI